MAPAVAAASAATSAAAAAATAAGLPAVLFYLLLPLLECVFMRPIDSTDVHFEVGLQ